MGKAIKTNEDGDELSTFQSETLKVYSSCFKSMSHIISEIQNKPLSLMGVSSDIGRKKDIETNVVLNQYIQHPVSFKGDIETSVVLNQFCSKI
ncbi:hypothetical protein NQ315_015115 [Exocentrus adspersus]|uniref:Uncharacterized protein n=1 Tax=Exocentrus adspersus TaxID=1586481 RepID=A0AAV8VAK7_9CUCU|nr:hypothetical protein NQ315_015115 [Exocentrus adspersus]